MVIFLLLLIILILLWPEGFGIFLGLIFWLAMAALIVSLVLGLGTTALLVVGG